MAISDNYERVDCGRIVVVEGRQRRKVEPDSGLIGSIKRLGVMNPIIVQRETMVLVAGERRLKASRQLGLPTIPVRFADELSPIEAQIVELEENLKREDLPWQDQVAAFARLHTLYLADDADWTQAKTAEQLNVSGTTISKSLKVAPMLGNEQISKSTTLEAAYNILARKDDRQLADVLSSIVEATATLGVPSAPPVQPAPVSALLQPGSGEIVLPPTLSSKPTPTVSAADPESILNVDFLEWAATYSGPKFNFIHCDFPYGKNVFAGPQSGRDSHRTYDDSPETYWGLIEGFIANMDRFVAYSAHMMFWLAADIEIQWKTISHFAQHAPSWDFQYYPLYWLKSDNAGILPDPKRGPRRIVETALIASRGDRTIAKAVSNAYAAPTDKAHHTSTKPQPMLQHFFQMFVDENSIMLDPTCGGGSALRAAEALGAKSVLGLERDPEHFNAARSALRQFRVLRRASK